MNSAVFRKSLMAFLKIPGISNGHQVRKLSLESTVLLSSGHRMPIVGLGTCHITDEESVQVALTTAIDVGYKHFDTAFAYQNLNLIGSSLCKLFESGKIKREELFITDKLPYNGLHPDSVEYFFKKSAAALQINYVDLYLIHSPIASKRTDNDNEIFHFKDDGVITENIDLVETWRAMEMLVDKGLVKSIGLSNFNSKQIQRIYEAARIKPANIQVECHAYLPQSELFDFCQKLNISFTAYCPLGSPAFPEFARNTLGLDYNAPKLLDDNNLKPLVEKLRKTPAQILLRYLVQQDMIVIPKSSSPQRIKENAQIFDFSLENEDLEILHSMKNGFRYIKLDFWKGMKEHPEYPFHIPF